MEIPKNTTQIGEVHGNYKVFIEDYVISYIKQLCRQEPDRKKRIGFYGVVRSEEPQQYFFVYGGAEVKRHGRGEAYLTEQDYEEITWAGGKYFEEYIPIGFVTVEDEVPEGIYLFYNGKEVYVEGYHIFYEKNESMLAFLIQRQNQRELEKENEITPESVEQETAVNVRRGERAGERKEEPVILERKNRTKIQESASPGEIKLFGIVKSAAVALLIVLCVTAVSTINGMGKMEGTQNFFQKAFQAMTEKKLPDKEEDMLPVSAEAVVEEPATPEESIVENNTENTYEEESTAESEDASLLEKMEQENQAEETTTEQITEFVAESETEAVEEDLPAEESTAEVNQTHVVQAGETLLSISKAYYGNENQVQAICELNGIPNSDNIQVGQKIILP